MKLKNDQNAGYEKYIIVFKDALGTQINAGDRVAYITSGQGIKRGIIKKLSLKNKYYNVYIDVPEDQKTYRTNTNKLLKYHWRYFIV